jgi:hypothetical protein
MLGELQEAAALLVPELIIFQTANSVDSMTAWHPSIHEWGTNGILDQFCYAIATSLSRGSEPSLTCTLWHYDRAKEVLLARGTVGFDYEYLARRVLLMGSSFTGKVIKAYAKIKLVQSSGLEKLCETHLLDQLTLPALRVHRLNLLSATETPRDADVTWDDFSRKRKVRNMGIAELIVAPVFRDLAPPTPADHKLDPTVGSVNIYLYTHYPPRALNNAARGLQDEEVLRLAEYTSRMVADIYVLQRRVIAATLMARLAEWSQLALPPFEIIKVTLQECMEADGCSVLCVDPQAERDDAKRQHPAIRCMATSGLSFHGVAVAPSEGLYTLEELKQHEIRLPTDRGKTPIEGVTVTLLGRGGRTIRMHDVADSKEVGRMYLRPAAYPGREPISGTEAKTQAKDRVRFIPKYLCTEAMNPGESYHHRYLGVSFGSSGATMQGGPALAAFRLIRGIYSRPFVRHDEYVVQDVARMTGSLFEAWVCENKRFGDRIDAYLGRPYKEKPWPPPLVKNKTTTGPETPVEIRTVQSRQEAAKRLVYAAVGPIDWNRNSIIGFLQDLLTVFDQDWAILACVRFTTVGENGQVVLRLYEVLSVYTQNPPEENRGADISCRRPNPAWNAIFAGHPRIGRSNEDCHLVHRDSDLIKCGIVLPFKFFAHGHAVDGVVSIDFGSREERMDTWHEPRWQAEHLQFLALATRQFTWTALSNNPRDSLARADFEILENEPKQAWQWFCRQLDKHFNDAQSIELVQIKSHRVRLFNSQELGKCVLVAPSDAQPRDIQSVPWSANLINDEARHQGFVRHLDDSPAAELVLYGAHFENHDWLTCVPDQEWQQRVVFPLFLGAACAGHIECQVLFKREPTRESGTKSQDQGADRNETEHTEEDQGADGNAKKGADGDQGADRNETEQAKVARNKAAWSKHFRELRWTFSRVTELWCQFANGNLMLSTGKGALWSVKAKKEDGQFRLAYSWGPWARQLSRD